MVFKKQYGITATTVKNILKENNVRVRGYDEYNYRRFTLDETCLDQIDSELKAYYLGFFLQMVVIITETNYKNNLNRITIRILNTDRNILESFAKNLYKTNKEVTVIPRSQKNDKWQDIASLEIQSKEFLKHFMGLEQHLINH